MKINGSLNGSNFVTVTSPKKATYYVKFQAKQAKLQTSELTEQMSKYRAARPDSGRDCSGRTGASWLMSCLTKVLELSTLSLVL